MKKLAVDEKTVASAEMIKDYKQEMLDLIMNLYPKYDEMKVIEIIDDLVAKKVTEVPIVTFENNYTLKNKKTSLFTWYKWYKDTKPITTEHGVCYKPHTEATNLAAKLLEYILGTRKVHKKEMFNCKVAGDSEGEEYHNVRQKVFKIFANSYYGATGNSKSIFYNLFTALSITGKGQSLITNAATSFERFFADNFSFNNYGDLCIYVNNIVTEGRLYKDKECLSSQVTLKKVAKRLLEKLPKNIRKENINNVKKMLTSLSKKDLNRIYYKNNLYEFCKQPKINKLINVHILSAVDSFKDPNSVPEEIKEPLEKLWSYIKEFVYYEYPNFDRINQCKAMTRNSVIVVDTDSNMLNMEPWIDFLVETGGYDKKDSESIYKMVNVGAYILGNMIHEVHEKYTKDCGVPEDKRSIIDMKNEFLMRRLLTTSNKKSYASVLMLQEGKIVDIKDSLDIKGLTIKKSNVNKKVGNTLQDILEGNILRNDNVDISTVLQGLENLETTIRTSIANREIIYAKPDKSNEPDTYATPFQMPAVRGILTWNSLYPDKEITFPAQVNSFKLTVNTLFDISLNDLIEAEGEEEGSRIYNILEEKIFGNENLKDYGLSVISLPKTENTIPKWLCPYIDVDTIIADSLSNFIKILGSIGVKTIPIKAGDLHYSNVISF